jgi:hypothetical protein
MRKEGGHQVATVSDKGSGGGGKGKINVGNRSRRRGDSTSGRRPRRCDEGEDREEGGSVGKLEVGSLRKIDFREH